ncbi:universal stress protein [Sporosarcina sp. CAU 1771]
MYKNILVAIDGSDNSKRAAAHAAHIASLSTETKVGLIYILDYDPRTYMGQVISRDDLHSNRKKQIEPIETIFDNKHITHELFITHGEPGPTIVHFANNGPYDLVIVGSRGLNTLQEMILGSVSHKVAKHVKAPVLIVK